MTDAAANHSKKTSHRRTKDDKKRYFSIQYLRTKMILWILIFLLPILIILCVSMNGILSSYRQQMTINYSQSLRQFTADIDSALTVAKRTLYSEDFFQDFTYMEPGSGLIALQNMQDLGAYLTDRLTTQERLDAFFLYDDEKAFFVQNYNTSYTDNRKVADTLTEYIEQNQDQSLTMSGDYQVMKMEDNYYFYLGVDIGEGIFGCWFSADRLLQNIRSAEQQGVLATFFSLPDGTALSCPYDSMDENEIKEVFPSCTMISQELSAAPFYLTVLWDKDVIYRTLYRTQGLMIGVTILSFVFFLIYVIFLRHSLFIPLRRLTENIDRLGTEQAESLVRSGNESVEFQSVYRALIAMTGEIRDLRIDVYEKELQQQKTQLDLYQLQIRPHFFMNVLNNIQCLVRSGKLSKTDEMITMLTCHCRYVLYSSQFVLLDEELNFIQNYIRLQSIQHNQEYGLSVDCPEEVLDYEIPILMIQILVENVIKHAGGSTSPLRIQIQVCEETEKEESYLHIAVMDNGSGFSKEVLQKLQNADILHHPGDNHGIGIDNIRKRLVLIYGEKAGIHFQNQSDKGTRVELWFPVSHIV